MRISKWLWSAVFMVGLLCATALAQKATEEQIRKAREILENTPTPGAPAPAAPPIAPATPTPAAPAPSPKPSSPVTAPTPAPKVTPEVAVPKAPAPTAPGTTTQQERLDELMQRYRNGELSPAEYHQARAKILNKPAGFYQPKSEPPPPKPNIPVLDPPIQPIQPTKPVVASSTNAAPRIPASAPASAPGKPTQADAALEAALVPGADLVLRLDFKSARQAPIYPTFKALQDKQSKASPGGSEATQELGALSKSMEKALGIKEEDVEGVMFSADLDGTDWSQVGADPSVLKSVRGVLGVKLAKAVSPDQIKQAIGAVAESGQPSKVKVTEEKIGSDLLLTIVSEDPSDPHVHMAVASGTTIFAGLNRDSVSSALQRFGGEKAKLESSVSGAMNMIAPGAQMKLGFVVPKALKDMLTGLAASGTGQGAGNQGAAGPAAMLSGLTDIRSLALGVSLEQDLALSLSGDMGNADTANTVNMLVGVLRPQFKASMAEGLGRKPESISDKTLVSSVKGSLVQIKLSMDKDMIQALAKD